MMLTQARRSAKGGTLKDASPVKQRNRLLELMNSRGTGVTSGVDLLHDATSAARIFRLFTPEGGQAGSIEKLLAEVREIRDVLSEIVASPGNRSAWTTLNRLAERVQFSARLQRGQRSELGARSGKGGVAS